MNVQALLSICVCGECIQHTCDVSHECRFRLRVESNYAASVVVAVYRACRFFLSLFPLHIHECIDGRMECE